MAPTPALQVLALMIMTRVDWNRVGFAAGSKTDALDWKDWKRPLMSLLNAKLLRKSTYSLSEKEATFRAQSTYQVGYRGVEQDEKRVFLQRPLHTVDA
jgi:hypothetical protein